jgi:hypothetical protein
VVNNWGGLRASDDIFGMEWPDGKEQCRVTENKGYRGQLDNILLQAIIMATASHSGQCTLSVF